MKERVKRVNLLLKRAKQKGLDIDKITEGKSVETLARNSKSLANFEKRYERQKARPQIVEEVRKIDIKIAERKERREQERLRKIKRGIISDETVAELKWNRGWSGKDITKVNIRRKTEEVAAKYLYTYFKQISLEAEAQKKIDKLIRRFGVRLDIAYEFMRYMAEQSFKYEYDREFMRTEMDSEFRQMLYDRLDKFDTVLKKEFGI